MRSNLTIFKIIAALSFSFFSPELDAQCSPQTLPYSESFQSITTNNQLPNCWLASNLGGSCLTQVGTNNRAVFVNTGNDAYFISPAVVIPGGYSYAAQLQYRGDSIANTSWSNLSMYVSTSQSTVNMQLISTNSVLSGSSYSTISGAYNPITTSTLYFIVKATASQTVNTSRIYWDNFSVRFLCGQPSIGTFTIGMCSGSTTALSSIQSAAITSSFNIIWSNGSQSPTITVSPTTNTIYSYTLSNTVTGCAEYVDNFSIQLGTNNMSLVATKSVICSGDTSILTVSGMQTYAWSNGFSNSQIAITPSATTVYSVIGMSSNAMCQVLKSVQITVKPSPTIAISNATISLCKGENVSLSASGAVTYTWSQGAISPSISINPPQSTTISVVGSHTLNDCLAKAQAVINVNICEGISAEIGSNPIQVSFSNHKISITTSVPSIYNCTLYSSDGRNLISEMNTASEIEISTELYPSGIYFLKIQSEEGAFTWRKFYLEN